MVLGAHIRLRCLSDSLLTQIEMTIYLNTLAGCSSSEFVDGEYISEENRSTLTSHKYASQHDLLPQS